jgi:hypothetical protein
MNLIDLAKKNWRYCRGLIYDMNEDNAPMKFQIHPWGKEIKDYVKIP